MKKIQILLFVLFAFSVSDYAQQTEDNNKKRSNIKIGVELGADWYGGDTKKPDQIRQDRSGASDYGLAYSSEMLSTWYVGAKSEFFFWRNQLSFSTGIRFSKFHTSFDSDRECFLWLLNQQGSTIDYVRIREIEQSSYYLGIPLEFRLFPKRRELPFQPYFKIGSILNYRVQTKNHITFQDKSMIHHSEAVDRQIGRPNNFNSYIYPAIGFKIVRVPWINVEFHYPGIMITPNSSSFVKPILGGGIQVSIQLPVGENVPIGTY